MATIRTAIELTDGMTTPLHNMLNALNLTIAGFQDMQNTAAQSIDTSSLEAAREQINQATIALNEFEAAGKDVQVKAPPVVKPVVEPVVPDPLIEAPAPVEVPVSWQSDGMEIFTNSGIDRFESEIQSTNTMLNTLHSTQQQIANTAAQTDIFPDNMTADLNNVNSRIQKIQSIIEKIENNPINKVTSNDVNNDIEKLRSKLNQAVQQQNQLNQAMQKMDITSANAAYTQLSNTISETEVYLRDNVNEQGKFNQMVQTGQKQADSLMTTVKRIAAAYLSFQTVLKALDISDTMALSESRLSLIVDDGGSVQALEDKIFASAQRSRAAYQDTVNTVSKLGLLAGKSFSNNDEIIKFQELMNKNFVIGGASATEQANAMYQLTQSMAAGKLQGDEFRSITENAPLLAKAIENYMVNVEHAQGSMKDWAADGKLTAAVIKNALFSSADEIEQRFNSMPMTFGQVWTSIKNNALMQFQPILKKMNEIANSARFNQLVTDVTGALVVVSGIVLGIFDMVAAVAQFMSDNWSIISPIIYGVVTALMIYAGYLVVTNAIELISNGIKWLGVMASYAKAAATGAEVSATAAATAAQWGLNTALLACPLTWIIIAIIAIIVIIYLVIAAINKATGSTISATGVIFGSICVLAAAIWNIIVGVINAIIQFVWTYFVEPWIGIVEWILNVCNGGFNSFGDAVANLLGQIISWFLSLGKVVTKIIDAIFGTNWTDGLNGLQDSVLAWGKNDNAITISRDAPTLESMTGGAVGRWQYSDAWNTGYSAGEKVDETIANFDPASLFQNNIPNADDYANSSDPSQYLSNISDNTDSIAKDNVDISDEELKYLRDIAERDAINRYTTAEVKVDLGGVTNHVSSDVDLDGMVTYLSDKVAEQLEIVAEGVHE
jgi:tape measure domain-containing protein